MSVRARSSMAIAGCAAGLLACLAGSMRAAADYPLAVTLDAKASTATATIASTVSIHVDRLMEENRRKRVTDALRYGGYGNFVTALRALPPIGTIGVGNRTVEIRYAREEGEADGRRLLLIADRPLFFLGGDPSPRRAGYELTVVDLHFDAHHGVTGTMAGAARVKPSPNGVVLDDYAEVPVQLAARTSTP